MFQNPSAAFTTVPVHELIEGDTRVGMQIVQGIDPVAHPPPPVVPSFQRVLNSSDSSESRFTNGKGKVVG